MARWIWRVTNLLITPHTHRRLQSSNWTPARCGVVRASLGILHIWNSFFYLSGITCSKAESFRTSQAIHQTGMIGCSGGPTDWRKLRIEGDHCTWGVIGYYWRRNTLKRVPDFHLSVVICVCTVLGDDLFPHVSDRWVVWRTPKAVESSHSWITTHWTDSLYLILIVILMIAMSSLKTDRCRGNVIASLWRLKRAVRHVDGTWRV